MERTLSCGYRPGFVKSICYQTLPFVFDKMSRKCAAGGSVVVVVSPPISLMEDQVASLRKRGVNVAIVTSGGGVSNEFCAIDDCSWQIQLPFLCSRSSHQFQVEGSTRTRSYVVNILIYYDTRPTM